MMLFPSIDLHIVQFLTGEITTEDIWKVQYKTRGATAHALACTASTYRDLLRSRLAKIHQCHKLQATSTWHITTFLAGSLDDYKMDGEKSKERAKETIPLFRASPMWAAALDGPILKLYMDHSWYCRHVVTCNFPSSSEDELSD